MFIVFLSLLNYFNFGKYPMNISIIAVKTESIPFLPHFLLSRQSQVAKYANCNFILANCFIQMKNASSTFLAIIK